MNKDRTIIISEEIKNSIKEFSNLFKTMPREIQKSLGTLKEINIKPLRIKSDITEILKESGKKIKELMNNLPASFKKLLNLGWYLNFLDMTPRELYDFDEVFKSDEIEKINKCLMDIVEEKSPTIQKRIFERFPNRKEPLQAAFNAHNNNEYYLSIPVFLAQADGICIEEFKNKFFKTRNRKPILSTVFEEDISSDIRKLYINPLFDLSAINSPEDTRSNYRGTLNRHEVLHGISNNYGTKINSLQSVALLDYILGLLE